MVFAFLIAAQAKNASLIENCHITATDIKYDCSWGDDIYVGGLVGSLTGFSELAYCYSALDFIDNTAPGYTAALVYTLDSESDVYYNASFCSFANEPGLADSTDNAKYMGRYNSCGIMRSDSASVNIYFRASEGNSPEKMNSAVAGDKFGGAFEEGRVHPVLVDYEAFKGILEK